MKIRLIGISPKKQPCDPEDGWYELSEKACPDIRTLLENFGLSSDGLTVLRNGRHAKADDTVENDDEIQIFIKSLGG